MLEMTVEFINRSSDIGNSQIAVFAAASAPPRYTLRFHNDSGKTQTFVCYQTFRGPRPVGSSYALAWFAMPVATGVQVNFRWQPVFDLVWMETGSLAPGVQAMASEVVPASLEQKNMITLTYLDGAFGFHDQFGSGQPDNLTVRTDVTIPVNTASVGIGMAGAPIQVVQAQADMNYSFSPQMEYWVTVADVVQGQVMDVTALAGKAQVSFPANVTAMTATLTADQSWTVQQGLA